MQKILKWNSIFSKSHDAQALAWLFYQLFSFLCVSTRKKPALQMNDFLISYHLDRFFPHF